MECGSFGILHPHLREGYREAAIMEDGLLPISLSIERMTILTRQPA